MLKKILIGLGILVAGILIYAAFLPPKFQIARETVINAPPERIFPYLNEPRKVDTWNPWMKLDPQIKMTYSGPESGVGATSAWEGNSDVGVGSITIVESTPPSLVRAKLDYLKPFKSTSLVEYTLKPEGTQTKVSWSFSGESAYFARIMCLFMNMDKMMGGMFEKGLAELKTLVESGK
jgi:uncharacterized protein YndB with AHSA1/START domain